MGRQGAAQVERLMGLHRGGSAHEYVSRIGEEMAVDTERPDLPWTFGIADVSGVNAFALPGGFIYVTRDILAHFNSEAELAAVLGHEIGHVTARHSVEQMSRQQLAQIGLGLGTVLSEDVARFSDLLGLGVGILFLKYSREDERQADRLGVRYMLQARYDPREAVDVFQMLERYSDQGGGTGVPTWLSTHPPPEDRIEEIRNQIDTIPAGQLEGTITRREAFLRRIEGLPFGPDPRDGFFRGDVLIHPSAKVRIAFPQGWKRESLPLAVNAVSQSGDALVRSLLGDTASMQDAARRFFSAQGIESRGVRETTLGGFDAVIGEFRTRSQGEVLQGRIAFVDGTEATYTLLGVSPAAVYSRHAGTFRAFFDSFARLTDRSDLGVQPLRIELVRIDAPATVRELLSRRSSALSAEALAILNGVEVDETLPAGSILKWVVGELPEEMR